MKADSTKNALDQVRNPNPSIVARIAKVVKSFGAKPEGEAENTAPSIEALSPAAQTAVKAVGRILAPHKDEITDAHLDAIQAEVGIMGSGDEGSENVGCDCEGAQTCPECKEGSSDSEGESNVKPEHIASGQEVMQKAYKEHMEKLGYKEGKYPNPEITMKSGKKKPSDESEGDDESENDDEEEETVSKTAQPILKEDGSLNLEAVPAEMRPAFEVIAKAQVAAEGRAKAAEEKAAGLEKVLKEEAVKTRKAEIVAKAEGFKNLSKDHSVMMLEMADGAGAEKFETVCKALEVQDKQIADGKLFSEIGSSRSNQAGGDNWSKIEKAAEGIVQKANGNLTQAQAIAQFLDTPEGTEMYNQHQASRKGGI